MFSAVCVPQSVPARDLRPSRGLVGQGQAQGQAQVWGRTHALPSPGRSSIEGAPSGGPGQFFKLQEEHLFPGVCRGGGTRVSLQVWLFVAET